jgi:hypothetical protein
MYTKAETLPLIMQDYHPRWKYSGSDDITMSLEILLFRRRDDFPKPTKYSAPPSHIGATHHKIQVLQDLLQPIDPTQRLVIFLAQKIFIVFCISLFWIYYVTRVLRPACYIPHR